MPSSKFAQILSFKSLPNRTRCKFGTRSSSRSMCFDRKTLHTNSRPTARSIFSSQPWPQVPLPHNFLDLHRLKPPRARSIFIQTEHTPNPDVGILTSDTLTSANLFQALKFIPNHDVLPEDISTQFLEYLSPRSTLAPPHPSPLAARLLDVDGITSVFYGSDFITVTKAADTDWPHVKPEVFSLITEAITSGEQIVNTVDDVHLEAGQEGGVQDTLRYDEHDSEVVGMIKELLETRIRPSIQEDGGDIEFRGFESGNVLLKLRGACRTCSSSTVTLKNGIESMLMHYVSLNLLRWRYPQLDEKCRLKKSKESFKSWMRKKRSPCKSLPNLKNG